MLDAARRDLARMRSNPADWQELRYVPALDADGRGSDENAARRAAVLWVLQYESHQPEDLALVRWLAQEEATCRHKAPGNGMTEVTELAGLLLAEHRQLDDVWLQYKIKMANFDTYCGYDRQHLVAAGPHATIEYVRNSGHPDTAKVLDLIMEEDGTPQIQEPDLEAWFLSRREWFPADPADENPLVWVERADQLGDKTLARRLLDDWAAGRPRDERTLSTLRWKLVDFGTYAEAADVMREMLSLKPNSASDLLHLAELERKAHRHDAAWESLQDCRRALENEDGWQDVGLGRFYIGELFLLAGAAPEPLSHVVFAQADREAPTVSRLAPVTLRAALDAARKIGHPSEAQYQHLRDAEDERIGRPPVDD